MKKTITGIRHALVEEKRPPIYTAMKYWGKKPHSIWRDYICAYTPEGGVVFDPFAGSAVAAFEAVKAGRKAVVFDINPLTSFLIEVYCAPFDAKEFKDSVESIISEIENDRIYQDVFSTRCKSCGAPSADIVQSCKWEKGRIYQVGVLPACRKCQNKDRYLRNPSRDDHIKGAKLDPNDFKKRPFSQYWTPDKEFHESPSFSASFIEKIGGRRFLNLWTGRNLYVLARIFDLIRRNRNDATKMHLMLGFISTLHLCTKMCVPRNDGANRPFATSWGRSGYICADRQMEMNPLLKFRETCLKRQSVLKSVGSVAKYIGKIPKILRVEKGKRVKLSKGYDIKYGIVDAVAMGPQHISKNDGVDFIITDPPYGGLVQYLDLSAVWLVWLEKHDHKMWPDYNSEVTIKTGIQDEEAYTRRMTRCFHNMKELLPDGRKFVFTFHNQKIPVWNAFLRGLFESGLVVERVIHQPNRRTGESVVANPYGTSGNDFYIQCVKAGTRKRRPLPITKRAVLKEAESIIALRNEPTPYQILFNGLLAAISAKGFNMDEFDYTINQVLSDNDNEILVKVDEGDKHTGPIWWLSNPGQRIRNPDLTLSDRVRGSVLRILRNQVSVSLDEALAEIYVNYPNGLTPDKKSVLSYLKEYATQSHGRWVYRGDDETGISEHTEILRMLAYIGRGMKHRVNIGKRESSERCSDKKLLSEHGDSFNLNRFLKSPAAVKRVEQIDMLWIDKKGGICAIEVENTTTFVHGIQRASNLGAAAPKVMVVPDARIGELTNVLRDDLTRRNFEGQSWRYIKYSSVRTLFRRRNNMTKKLWDGFLCSLDDLRAL